MKGTSGNAGNKIICYDFYLVIIKIVKDLNDEIDIYI